MFRKLVSNLPYNPSLINQLSFYAIRLKKESSIRRLGFGFIALAMLVQIVAVMAPPEKSLAYSDNHIINGVNTKSDILRAWDYFGSDVSQIYGHFGVSRDDINALPEQPNATIVTNDGADWWSVGRNSLSGYSNIADWYKAVEISQKVSDTTTVYMRPLKAWDTRYPYSRYAAFKGVKKSDGKTFWILKDCGNYTQIGKTEVKPPNLDVRKSIIAKPDTAKPGDELTYRLEYRNKGVDSLAENAFLQDELDLDKFDIVSPANLPINNKILQFPVGNLTYTANYKVLDIKIKLKNPLANGTKICNTVRLMAKNTTSDTSGPVCVSIMIPCPYNSGKPSNSPDCVKPKLSCSITDAYIDQGTKEVTLKTKVTSTNSSAVKIKNYDYNFGDGKSESHKSSSFSDTRKHIYESGKYTANVKVSYTITGEERSTKELSCSSPVEIEEDQALGQAKTVSNLTQKLDGDSVIGSTVKPGDDLEYKLKTTNTQSFDRENYIVTDYVGDLLDYADINLEHLKKSGAKYNETTKTIEWPKTRIPANGDKTQVFRIRIKNPIPSTNSPSSVSTDFDCKISNKYGNELTINVACPYVKGVESLPNTGPGASLVMGFVITSFAGYFFARSRLMTAELTLIKNDSTLGGA